eukprot:SAG11_NODE_1675_length_4475_cov_20.017824_4_plen_177_part_00
MYQFLPKLGRDRVLFYRCLVFRIVDLSLYLEAFGALAEASGAQMGDGGVVVGGVAASDDDMVDKADDDAGGCGMQDIPTAEGWQAAEGGCAADMWRSRTTGTSWGRRLEPTTGSHADAWRCWAAAWLKAMKQQQRRQRQHVEAEEGAATWGNMPARKRLWLARKRRRRRRLEGSAS